MSDPKLRPAVDDDGYRTLTELAERARLPVRTLRRYLRDADHPLPHYRVGARVLVKVSEFDLWMRHYQQRGSDYEARAEQILAAMGARRVS
ncbi:MAG TPA: helix-turn-helix domain-containing protein [Burkholderiales bacterium]|nr:helix-turn-helix domain-containing protein [Burkholderiales bacterium]